MAKNPWKEKVVLKKLRFGKDKQELPTSMGELLKTRYKAWQHQQGRRRNHRQVAQHSGKQVGCDCCKTAPKNRQ
ncbi:hypothetical protein PTKIN_Ptkin14bG0081500 [Pterospermum kingtungense]